MRIFFAATLSTPPFTPGSAWHRLQYVLGLRALGHEVFFVEETYRDSCVDNRGHPCLFGESVNARVFAETLDRFGLLETSCLVFEGGTETCGMSYPQAVAAARGADLLINMSGHLSRGPLLEGPAVRVYFDSDPVYTQLWAAEYGSDLGFAHHDVFLTGGLNVGTDRVAIPDCGLPWLRMPPPVFLPEWPAQSPPVTGTATSVVSWSVFGDLFFEGEYLGGKRPEIEQLVDLPGRVDIPVEMMVKHFAAEDDALASSLRRGGWIVRDSEDIASLDAYRSYVASSACEIGVAKQAYAKANSGWFSDRSSTYLATGRPVVHRATGFEEHLPTGVGLLSYATVEEAAEALSEIGDDLDKHGRAARDIAEEYLATDKVLPRVLDEIGTSVR